MWADLSIGSVLERLVLKNDAECTSRRVKRTSGARVLIFIFVARSLEVNVNKVNVNKVNVNKVNVKVNVNKVNDKVNDIYSIHSHYKGNHRRGAAAEGRGTSFVVARPQAAPPL